MIRYNIDNIKRALNVCKTKQEALKIQIAIHEKKISQLESNIKYQKKKIEKFTKDLEL